VSGKVCLITGGTSGIGAAVAKILAKHGEKVIIVGRNLEKSIETVNQIKQQTGNQNVDFMLADLSSLSQVRQLALDFRHIHPRLDVLVNNAGVTMFRYQETADGFETTFEVNYLSHFLLTNMLLDTLKASSPSRIINVSSAVHIAADIDLEDLNGRKKKYSALNAYARSKLANLLFTYELARLLDGSGVTVNAVHPGLVKSNLGRGGRSFSSRVWRILNSFGSSPEKGAATIVYLATSPEVENVTGKYFANLKPTRSSEKSYDVYTARKLWEISEKIVEPNTTVSPAS